MMSDCGLARADIEVRSWHGTTITACPRRRCWRTACRCWRLWRERHCRLYASLVSGVKIEARVPTGGLTASDSVMHVINAPDLCHPER
jgi:hypothetical protein